MTKVTYGVTVSLDGFIAGNNMSLKESFANIPADLLMDWRFIESEKHQAKIDSLTTAGAFIMDSNMFEPKDHRMTLDWKGQWDKNPPFHAPVFILSHEEREPITMEGGTTFTFVADGIESAMQQARAADF